jgi:hypothetical protein
MGTNHGRYQERFAEAVGEQAEPQSMASSIAIQKVTS